MLSHFRHAFVLIAVVIAFISEASSAGYLSRMKKSLPLDGIPNVVLKSPANSQYLPDRIIVKMRSGMVRNQSITTFGIAALDLQLKQFSVSSIQRLYEDHHSPGDERQVDLTRFYVLKYSSPVDPFMFAAEVSKFPDVEYAEPWFIYPIDDVLSCTPNDPSYAVQWALSKIQADTAWCVSSGDSSVVIGIVDTGVQWDHPDLSANIWVNPGENGPDGLGGEKRTNGIDDDGDGKIDDWHGWDFGGGDYNNPIPDNNPTPTSAGSTHGTHVAGLASATTNNGVGIAGVGYRCRILPVKATSDNDARGSGGTPYVVFGFEGIVYAADMGASVVNCSWGGLGGSQFEQEMIDYAVQKGTLVVAAAGNRGTTAAEYPGAYRGVLSVAATVTNDAKASFSNYGPAVDVSAPGLNIYSTYYPSSYANMSGTSMASPITAGLATLVKSQFSTYSPLQVGEQVRVSCDDIDAVNPSYAGQLGKGRINAFKALTISSPSLRMTSFVIHDSVGGNNNSFPEPNEDINIIVSVTNYLQPTTAGTTIALTSTDPYVLVTNGGYAIGSLPTGGNSSNASVPFQIHINSNAPPAHLVTFKLTMTDISYNDIQLFTLLVNPTFSTQNINNVQVTLTNRGQIGFNDFPTNAQGIGFVFGGQNHLFEGGLLIGTSSTKLVDCVRNEFAGQNLDFTSAQLYNMVTPGSISSQDGSTMFVDDGASTTSKLGLKINMYSYAYSTVADSNYVILRYDITNNSGADLSNLYAGLFFDWDVQNYATNRTGFDATRGLGYVWDTAATSPIYCGVEALEGVAGYRGLVNNASIDPTKAGKWAWLSGGIVSTPIGGDVHNVISSGPYSIVNGAKRMLAFALVGGRALIDLQSSADAAQTKWLVIKDLVNVTNTESSIPSAFALYQNYPNPFNPTTRISFDLPRESFVSLDVYDILGREVASLIRGHQPAGRQSVSFNAFDLGSGMYFYRLRAGEFLQTRKLMIVR